LIAILIADDLTGSLDSIAPFAERGMRCVTAVSPTAIVQAVAHAPDVLSVNLGTRELPPEDARRKAMAAAHILKEAAGPDTVWIKKIDSRLKGPIAAEIGGLSDVLPVERVLLCPAIPDLGRVVLGGGLRGTGIDQEIPIAQRVKLALPCSVPDATSDDDLDLLARTLPPGTLVAAARGLASALARRLCQGRPSVPVRLAPGPIGIVVGSRDPVTLSQVALLGKSVSPPYIKAPDGEVSDFEDCGSFLIQATEGAGASGSSVSTLLAAGVVNHISRLTSLVMTGGETAASVLQAADIGLLSVRGEVLPGLPLSSAIDRPGFPDIVTKSGGFGPPDTLLRLWQDSQRSER
jgi:uncharacterized protein YgbK (DUF1537 family)